MTVSLIWKAIPKMHEHRAMSTPLREGLGKISEGISILNGGPLNYYVDTMCSMVDTMFERFCPWKPGDRVELNTTPDIEKSSGWYSSRHFLIAGARGTIQSVDFYDGLFRANIVFDDESWLDDEGKPQPVINKHTYSFSEKSLRKCNA